MDRREFLKTSGGAAAAAAAATSVAAAQPSEKPVAAPAISTGIAELRLAMRWPDGVAGFGENVRRFARRIEAVSAGRMRMDLKADVTDGLAAVQRGDADLYAGTEHDNVGLHPAFGFFAGLPGDSSLGANVEAWIMAGGGQMLWDDLAGAYGVKPLAIGHTGPIALWARRAIDAPADIAGKRIHVMGLAREVVRGLGAEPADIPAGRLAAALADGELVAAEWGGPIAARALGLPDAGPEISLPAFNPKGSALSLSISRRVWDRLSESDRAVFEACAAEQFRTSYIEEQAHYHMLTDMHRRKHPQLRTGLHGNVREILHAREQVTAAVVAQVAGSDAIATRINASYETFRRDACGYFGGIV